MQNTRWWVVVRIFLICFFTHTHTHQSSSSYTAAVHPQQIWLLILNSQDHWGFYLMLLQKIWPKKVGLNHIYRDETSVFSVLEGHDCRNKHAIIYKAKLSIYRWQLTKPKWIKCNLWGNGIAERFEQVTHMLKDWAWIQFCPGLFLALHSSALLLPLFPVCPVQNKG